MREPSPVAPRQHSREFAGVRYGKRTQLAVLASFMSKLYEDEDEDETAGLDHSKVFDLRALRVLRNAITPPGRAGGQRMIRRFLGREMERQSTTSMSIFKGRHWCSGRLTGAATHARHSFHSLARTLVARRVPQ